MRYIKKGGIDSNRIVDFINKFINVKYKNKLIILDNASSHRNQLVKDVLYKDNNIKDVLDEIPIHIYKNLIKGAYDKNSKYVKQHSTIKRKPKNIWIR